MTLLLGFVETKMEKHYIVSPKIIRDILLHNLLMLVLLEIAFAIFSKSDYLIMALAAIFITIINFAFSFSKYRNAFILFSVNEIGISTKYTNIEWEEIESFEVMETKAYKIHDKNPWYMIKCPSIVCIGSCEKDKSVFAQNKHQCVFFSLTKKHLKLIEKYGKGKSAAIDQLLEYYLNIVEE